VTATVPHAPLLEREAELAVLSDRIAAATLREGGLVLIEGEAGIGKTALLRATRAQAAGRGFTVLSATASELDRDFPFGVVHQLLDGVVVGADDDRRARLFAGAAALAEPLLAGEGGSTAPDPAYAVLHGLYWLCANLAEEAPLLLAVDDLHWTDRASLRFLEFAGRRLEGLSMLIGGTTRTGEPGADMQLIGALAAGPVATTLQPGPLSAPASARLLADSLGHEPEPGFADAVRSSTGGNPLLLRELARAAAEAGLSGAGAEAGEVAAIGAAGVAAGIRRRLGAMGADVLAVARAAAVLGERARLDDVAGLAEREGAQAAAAVDQLVRAGVIEPGGRGFVHPLVREAVLSGLPPSARAALHAGAARRLAARGARADEVAVHLLATDPAGDPEVVERLREAARLAVTEGAPEAALPYLRRALSEPPPPDRRGAVLLELGEHEATAGIADAGEHLEQALASTLAPADAARARVTAGRILLLSDPPRAVGLLQAAMELAPEPALRTRLESVLLDAITYDLDLLSRRHELLDELEAADPDDPVMRAHRLVEAAYTGRPQAEVNALATPLLDGDRLLRALGPASGTYHLLCLALRHAELPERSRWALQAQETPRRAAGSRLAMFYVSHGARTGTGTSARSRTAEALARRGWRSSARDGLVARCRWW
jgi:hypothetical protein